MKTVKITKQEVEIVIDEALKTKHPKHDFIYTVNYAYVLNVISGDVEELDAYLLGVFDPVESYKGKCIAVIHRTNDDDDKIIVVPNGVNYTDEQIRALTEFQERFFDSIIIR